jgi:hypothetical protein
MSVPARLLPEVQLILMAGGLKTFRAFDVKFDTISRKNLVKRK